MKAPKPIEDWDIPDSIESRRFGGDHEVVPIVTAENIAFLIERHNELVEVISEIAKHCHITFEE